MKDVLGSYGWSRRFRQRFDELRDPGLRPARVIQSQRDRFRLRADEGTVEAVSAGALRHRAADASVLPVVGDWVAYQPVPPQSIAPIHAVLARRNQLSRKVAGARAVEQVVAANVDLVLLVMGLDGDYNLRRLERFLALAEESGARSAVVLNKADLCDQRDRRLEAARGLCSGRPIVMLSAVEDDLSMLEVLLAPRETAVLVGSSGVGKSTLINRLRGRDELRTQAVRAHDSRGRHTTTHRELFRLAGGALIIDNPGVREIQLWDAEEALPTVFDDISELARACRFADCRHESEPGCAVRTAIADGSLDPDRLQNLRRLESEAAALERRKNTRLQRERDKRLHKMYRRVQREKRDRQR